MLLEEVFVLGIHSSTILLVQERDVCDQEVDCVPALLDISNV